MRRRVENWLHTIWSERTLASDLLLPLSWLVAGAGAWRAWRARRAHPARPPVPLVVIGNILVGGTGKTPVVIALCQALAARGWHPGVVSRGYGVRSGPRPRLARDGAQAERLGDEPALIARATGAPVAVHPRRPLAVAALLDAHPEVDVILSDDGLQHLAMARDVEIIVQDRRGTGNGRLLPAGPLREPVARLARADWIIDNDAAAPPRPGAIGMVLRPVRAEHLASGRSLAWSDWRREHAGLDCSAAAAIGQPRRFFDMLEQAGLRLIRTLPLPDHHDYRDDPLRALPSGPVLVTAKDAVKCAALGDPRLWAIHVEAVFSDPGWIDALDARLREAQNTLDAAGHAKR
ncbi:tetraacyldisaccharide 4'-kinase [Castellaniella sp. GW247-6E4]|uniref:tetraacyldisaccharide 4'-kinase n=1 Tax=Castellaniella sp. GW247-6E4 TaxID=3140380 RepID=UPI003315F547